MKTGNTKKSIKIEYQHFNYYQRYSLLKQLCNFNIKFI